MNAYFKERITTILLVYLKKLLNKFIYFPGKTILYFNHLNIIKIKIHIIKMNHVNPKKLNNLDNQDRRGKPNNLLSQIIRSNQIKQHKPNTKFEPNQPATTK
jgi:hypothetical protein